MKANERRFGLLCLTLIAIVSIIAIVGVMIMLFRSDMVTPDARAFSGILVIDDTVVGTASYGTHHTMLNYHCSNVCKRCIEEYGRSACEGSDLGGICQSGECGSSSS